MNYVTKHVTSLYAFLSLAMLVSSANMFGQQKAVTLGSPSALSSSSSSPSSPVPVQTQVLTPEQRQEAFLNRCVEICAVQDDVAQQNLKAALANMDFTIVVTEYNKLKKAALQTALHEASYWDLAKYYCNMGNIVVAKDPDAKGKLVTFACANETAKFRIDAGNQNLINEHAAEIFDAYVATMAPAAPKKTYLSSKFRLGVPAALLVAATAAVVFKTGAYKKLSFKATAKK